MKNSEKMRSLCEELNMNFDEASELFGEETLQSMQMAKIVGGNANAVPWKGLWKAFCELVGAAENILNIQKAITGSDVATVAPDAEITIIRKPDGTFDFNMSGFSGILEVKGDTITVRPTPTPKPE